MLRLIASAELERRRRSKAWVDRYYNDPAAFCSDVFGASLWQKQVEIAEAVRDNTSVAVRSGHKIGKALALDTPIPTPSGWTTMGDLRVGDEVFDETGKSCRVTFATEVMHNHECFLVRFSDGTEVVADAEHQWMTWSAAARRSAAPAKNPQIKPSVVTTKQIRDTLWSNNRGRNHAIPVAGAIQCAERDLPLDPYLLGVWLGDGTSKSGDITTMDHEIVDAFASDGYDVKPRPSCNCGKAWTYTMRGSGEKPSLFRTLSAMGVIGNKHVPDMYLRASEQQRRALLAGLMDTDGTCAPNGSVEFINKRKCLSDAVYELAASLGFKPSIRKKRATCNGKDCGTAYRVTFTPHEPVFKLAQKLARQHTGKTKPTWVRQREIVAVDPCESVPVRCIQVDSPSHLFLCSRAFIPTHNTRCVASLALWWCATRPRGFVILTSSSYTQVEEQLWPEVRKMYAAAARNGFPLGGKLNQSAEGGIRWPDGRRMFGMSTDKPERMGGYSGDQLLFIVDEASGIDEAIFEAIEGNMAGGARKVLVGNPTQLGGTFYDAFHDQLELWHTIHVSSEQTPNVLAGEAVVPGLATSEWVERCKLAWGENDPRYQVRVRGNFPGQAANSVVGLTTVEDAIARWNTTEAEGRLELGVDVARFGDDDSVITARRGLKAFRPVTVHGQDTVQIAGLVLMVARKLRSEGERVRVKVDGIGVGGGVVDQLRHHDEIDVIDVNVAEAATCDDYANLRSQIMFGTDEWFKAGGAIPNDKQLKSELVAPTYKFDARGRQVVEPKADMKKRLKRSPDRFDSLALAIYSPPLPPRGVGERSIGLF